MAERAIVASLLTPLLAPLAVASGARLLVVFGVMFWMSGVHVLLTRFGRRPSSDRFPVAGREGRTLRP